MRLLLLLTLHQKIELGIQLHHICLERVQPVGNIAKVEGPTEIAVQRVVAEISDVWIVPRFHLPQL
jgi:hypothetical protein